MRVPITFGKIKFTVPSVWEEVTVKEFADLSRWSKTTPDDRYRLWQIFMNVDLSELKKIKLKKLIEADRLLSFLEFPLDISSLKEVKELTIEGKTIKIGDKLDFITYGQFLIAEKVVKEIQKANKGKKEINPLLIAYKSSLLAAIILYPELRDDEFSESKAIELSKSIESCKFVDIYPVVVFFCEKYSELKKLGMKGYNRTLIKTRWVQVLKNLLFTESSKP